MSESTLLPSTSFSLIQTANTKSTSSPAPSLWVHAITLIVVAVLGGLAAAGVCCAGHYVWHLSLQYIIITGIITFSIASTAGFFTLRCILSKVNKQINQSDTTQTRGPTAPHKDLDPSSKPCESSEIRQKIKPSLPENKIQIVLAAVNAYKESERKYEKFFKENTFTKEEADLIYNAHMAVKRSVADACFELHNLFYDTYVTNQNKIVERADLVQLFGTTESDLENLFKMYRFPKVAYTNSACLNSFFYHLCRHYAAFGKLSIGITCLKTLGNPLWPEGKKITTWDELADFVFSTPANCKEALRNRNVKISDNFNPNDAQQYLDELSYGQSLPILFQGMDDSSCLSFNDFSEEWNASRQWACHMPEKNQGIFAQK